MCRFISTLNKHSINNRAPINFKNSNINISMKIIIEKL